MNKTSKEEYQVISKIARRAVEAGISTDYMSTSMDLECVHEQLPLRLAELLEADAFNFSHDVCGIAAHLNRRTRELEDCFLPRFAEPTNLVVEA